MIGKTIIGIFVTSFGAIMLLTVLPDLVTATNDSRSDSSHIGLGLSLTRACANALSLDLHAELSKDKKQIHFKIKNKNTDNLKSSCSGNVEVIS